MRREVVHIEVMHKVRCLEHKSNSILQQVLGQPYISLKSDFCKIAETSSAIAALVGKTDVTVWSVLRLHPVPTLKCRSVTTTSFLAIALLRATFAFS